MVTPEIMEILVHSVAHERKLRRRSDSGGDGEKWLGAAENGGEQGEDGRTGEWVVSKWTADEEACSAKFISGERVDTHPHGSRVAVLIFECIYVCGIELRSIPTLRDVGRGRFGVAWSRLGIIGHNKG